MESYENLSTEQLIEEMTNALKDAIEVQQRYSEMLDKLTEENQFLTETITQNNLGRLSTERRKLIEENREIKVSSDKALRDAKRIRSEYEYKLDKIADITKDILSKQEDINKYIDQESEKKIQEIKQNLKNKYNVNKSELQEKFQKMEDKFNGKIKAYRIMVILLVTVAAALIVLLFLR